MLKTISYYAPLTSTITDWWYGSNAKQTNPPKNEPTSLLPVVPEEQKEASVGNEILVETPFITRLKLVEERPGGFSSEDDYVTGSEHYHSSRRNTCEGLLNDSTSQIPNIINEEDSQSDFSQHENNTGLLSTQHRLDDRVRQIILEGLSETNDEDDDLPSRRKSRSSLYARNRNSCGSSTMLSRSAPAGELRKAIAVQSVRHFREHTDSDSSAYFETPTKNPPKTTRTKSTSSAFPFSLFKSKKNDSTKPRRRAETNDEQTLILRVKTKSYGTTTDSEETTVLYSGNRSQVRSIHRQRDTENEDSDYPGVSLNTDHLSASYSSYVSHKRKSVSDLSCCSLNSSWSEYTISLPTFEVGQECNESDLESTVAKEYLSSTDGGGPGPSKTRNNRGKRQSIKPELLTGHYVKEMFLDNECYCCQCTII